MTADAVARATRLVDDVLSGKITPASNAAVFDDDLLYMSVRTLEREARDWLVSALGKHSPGRRLVLDQLSGELRDQVDPQTPAEVVASFTSK